MGVVVAVSMDKVEVGAKEMDGPEGKENHQSITSISSQECFLAVD